MRVIARIYWCRLLDFEAINCACCEDAILLGIEADNTIVHKGNNLYQIF